jgi:hypothetical protein
MPEASVKPELKPGAELLVRYAMTAEGQWGFQSAEMLSDQAGRILASYPSANEAARLLGSALRPALARLLAVLDRLRLQFPGAFTAQARLQGMSLSYLVSHYQVQDAAGAIICQWHNPAMRAAPAPAESIAPRQAARA